MADQQGASGKTFGLLIDPLRNINNPKFSAVIFRKSFPEIMNPGGLWDEAMSIYPMLGAEARSGPTTFTFPSGMKVKFSYMGMEADKLKWQGSQFPYLAFDEVTHFSQSQFFYMLSRIRSMSGVRGTIKATCNPDPDSWVAGFLSWWINQETGFPIEERSGIPRYFIRQGDEFRWADSKKELTSIYGEKELPKSVTFIPAKITDNQILLERDPTYLSNLMALNRVDRARLLEGNWKIRAEAGTMFRREWFEIVDAPSNKIMKRIRYWDRASSEPSETNRDPDWTAGVKLSKSYDGMFYVEHVERFRGRPLKVKERIRNTASQDGIGTEVAIEQDPGQAGVSEAEDMVRHLSGFIAKVHHVSKSKEIRAKPVSSNCEAGNIKIVRGDWNKSFLDELEAFPDGNKDDQVDALSGAYNILSGASSYLDKLLKM